MFPIATAAHIVAGNANAENRGFAQDGAESKVSRIPQRGRRRQKIVNAAMGLATGTTVQALAS